MLLGAAWQPTPTVTITDPEIPKRLTWDLCYRTTTASDELRVESNGAASPLVLTATREEPAKAITKGAPPRFPSHATLSTDGPAATATSPGTTWTLTVVKGSPEICGVVAEADPQTNPGVVLDTLGVNGARFATPLAWNEPAWAAELERRRPELVVLEFGTNEMSDAIVRPAMFTEQIRSIMARIRKVRPDTDCVALAPTDRADTEDRVPAVRDAIREGAMDNGCAFWDTYTIMGGAGSIRAWKSKDPPRAAKDGIHLAWRGYRELGTKLAEDMLRGYP
jgi:lysophospholipase L1-like esterase